jgi:hypothetical protein
MPQKPSRSGPFDGPMARWVFPILVSLLLLPRPADAQSADLAQQLANPVSSLISVPFQLNYDSRIGPDRDGDRLTLNIQPVVPRPVSADWNVISRTILPIIWQWDIAPGAGSQFGLGDTLQSLFFTPAKAGAVTWGVGPALLIPTGTDPLTSAGKWALGPTGVVLKQSGGLTYGALANHIWSFAGSDRTGDISTTYVNPFISYATKKATTFALTADVTYDWKADSVVMPINLTVSQLVQLGQQPVSIGGGLRWYAATNEASPHGLAARLTFTLLFPAGG